MGYNTTNNVTITGPDDEIARFKQKCLRTRINKHDTVGEIERWGQGQEYEPCIDFVAIDPLDDKELEQLRSGEFDLDLGTSFIEVSIDEPGRFKCEFDTQYGAPERAFESLTKMFPSLHFEMDGGTEDYSYEAKAHNGVFEIQSHKLDFQGRCVGGPRNGNGLACHEPVCKMGLDGLSTSPSVGEYQYDGEPDVNGKWIWHANA